MTRASPGVKAQWEHRLGEVAVDEDDLSRTVLDFLVADGHRDAVACFGREADLGPRPMSLSAAIHVRSAAVSATRSGDVSSGITQAIELSPEVRCARCAAVTIPLFHAPRRICVAVDNHHQH